MTHETKLPTLAETVAETAPEYRVHYYAGAARETNRQIAAEAKQAIDLLRDPAANWYDHERALDLLARIVRKSNAVAAVTTEMLQS